MPELLPGSRLFECNSDLTGANGATWPVAGHLTLHPFRLDWFHGSVPGFVGVRSGPWESYPAQILSEVPVAVDRPLHVTSQVI